MDYADNAITISREKIKAELSNLYKNANIWTLKAYTAENEGNKQEAKTHLSRRDKAYNRISGVETFLYHTSGIFINKRYVDDREYHMYGYPRIAYLIVDWDGHGTMDIVEIQGGEIQQE